MKGTSLSYSGGNYVRMDEWMLNVTGPGASRRAFVLFWVEETQLDETFHLGRGHNYEMQRGKTCIYGHTRLLMLATKGQDNK